MRPRLLELENDVDLDTIAYLMSTCECPNVRYTATIEYGLGYHRAVCDLCGAVHHICADED